MRILKKKFNYNFKMCVEIPFNIKLLIYMILCFNF